MTGPVVEYGKNESSLDDPSKSTNLPDQQDEKVDEADLLALAQAEPDKCAKKIQATWDQAKQHPTNQKREAQWKVNDLRRRGIPNVRLQKSENENVYTVWVPPGAAQAAPVVNEAATLCRKLTANLWADPPAPNVLPSSGDDDDRDSASLAERALIDLSGEGGINDIRKGRRAFDRAHVTGSGFIWYDVDPAGGGMGPQAVQASPQAATLDDALTAGAPYTMRFVTDEQDYQPPPIPQVQGVDPLGQPIVQQVQPPPRKARLLVDDPAKATQVPLPKLSSEVMKAQHIVMLPGSTDDITEAYGVIKGTFVPYGKFKRQFADYVAGLSDDAKAKLFTVKPAKTEGLYPAGAKGADAEQGDNRFVWVMCYVNEAGGAMPKGAYIVVAGGGIAYAAPWSRPVNGRDVPLDLPVTQYALWDEGRDDPYKVGTMEIVGPGNEVRTAQIGGLLTHLDRFNNRKVFYPSNSMLQPKQIQLSTGTYIPMNPGGGAPVHETIPPYPAESMEVFTITRDEMENSVAMTGVAQGLDSPNVQSGRHAYQVVAQAHAGLSELKQNIEIAYCRGCRIQLQLIRAFYTKPQLLKWSTEDGQHREKWFTGTDLGDNVDVQLAPGTLTMMTPAAKMALAVEWNQEMPGILSGDQIKRSLFRGIGTTLGIEDDPTALRIRRQLSDWADGPGQNPQALQQKGPQIWQPVPSDETPAIAQVRYQEIAQFMQSVKYLRWPPEWRQFVDQEFQHMQQILAPPPPPVPGGGPGGAPGQAPSPEAIATDPSTIDPSNPPLDNPVLTGNQGQ